MEEQFREGPQVIMNKEAMQYFLEGLRVVIKRSGLKQGEWAEGVTSPVNISNILRGKTGTSDEMREALAKRAGMDIAEIVLIGRQSTEKTIAPEQQPPQQSMIPGTATGHVDPNRIMTDVSIFVGQYQRNEERMRFWRTIFDSLPTPTLIIRDGLVCYQNVKSLEWGNISGTELCASCIGLGCENKAECPVTIAMASNISHSGFQMIGPDKYKIDVAPVRLHGHNYFIVMATEVLCGDERRAGHDRREQ